MLPIIILILISFGLCALMMGVSYLFAPKDKNSSFNKKSTYECGLTSIKKEHSKVSVKFFLTAILFVLFDIEIIFIYPYALAYREFLKTDYGLGIVLAMALFIIVFIFGLWWEIKTKALHWK